MKSIILLSEIKGIGEVYSHLRQNGVYGEIFNPAIEIIAIGNGDKSVNISPSSSDEFEEGELGFQLMCEHKLSPYVISFNDIVLLISVLRNLNTLNSFIEEPTGRITSIIGFIASHTEL